MRMKNIEKGYITHRDIWLCLAGLFGIDRTGYADIEFRLRDDFFRNSLKIKTEPSESTFSHRDDKIASADEMFNRIKATLLQLLKIVPGFVTEKVTPVDDITLEVRRTQPMVLYYSKITYQVHLNSKSNITGGLVTG